MGDKHLVWNVKVGGLYAEAYYTAHVADGAIYVVLNDDDGVTAFNVEYLSPNDDDGPVDVLARGVATVAEAKAIALRHYRTA